MKALLALEDGRIFDCRSFTGPGETRGEVVFNTGMSGYQEILTDPSYSGQMVVMTYPLIGNYGVNPSDIESSRIQAAGFIVREYQPRPSNFRSTSTLADYLKAQGIMGIEDIDTRALTRHIRKSGAMRGIISTHDSDPSSLIEKANKTPDMKGRDLAKEVTTGLPYFWEKGAPVPLDPIITPPDRRLWKNKGRPSLIALDFGIKYNMLRCLESAGFDVLVMPAATNPEMIKKLNPDALFLSNGPGDPEPIDYAVSTIKELLTFRPIFGICLGHQLLGLALGAKTFKLKFGHRGANQPVLNLMTKKVEITSQNHGFAVDTADLDKNDIIMTHINLNDNTLEGFKHRNLPILAVQYHPEASPGPHDATYLFDEFKKMIEQHRE